MNSGYFAFVRRDAERRYSATLPDFPGLTVHASQLAELPAAVRESIAEHSGTWALPPPTRQEALPRQPDDHEGYWLMVELDPSRGD